MTRPSTLSRDISPPRSRKASTSRDTRGRAGCLENGDGLADNEPAETLRPTLAAIEAGQADIRDHLEYFANNFRTHLRTRSKPILSIDDFQALYRRNQHRHGRHFVIHQHDHPISGVHYDLRLQFSESSTISFAIPYGLPGNANSVRPNRMAIETRVHTLWNNLIETASHSTGSLLIWDTGEYEVLPREQNTERTTDDELSDDHTSTGGSQSERLFDSFQKRRIRLRFHGTRLPPNYTISMWLPSSNDRKRQPKTPARKRRRIDPTQSTRRLVTPSDSESEDSGSDADGRTGDITSQIEDAGVASDHDEDETIRANNAYPGASNTIGSVHQRNWILTLDRPNSGFRKARGGPDSGRWAGGWDAFFVRGRDHERSIVTCRNADEVMEDEGVEKFVGRKMWRPIME